MKGVIRFFSLPSSVRHKMLAKNEDMTRFTDLSLNHFTSIKIIDSNENRLGEREFEAKSTTNNNKKVL